MKIMLDTFTKYQWVSRDVLKHLLIMKTNKLQDVNTQHRVVVARSQVTEPDVNPPATHYPCDLSASCAPLKEASIEGNKSRTWSQCGPGKRLRSRNLYSHLSYLGVTPRPWLLQTTKPQMLKSLMKNMIAFVYPTYVLLDIYYLQHLIQCDCFINSGYALLLRE